MKVVKKSVFVMCVLVAIVFSVGEYSITKAAELSSGKNVAMANTGTHSFKECYSRLKKEYGLFKKSQTGIMRVESDCWLDNSGIMSAKIKDFDNDGKNEMLVCIAVERPGEDYSDIKMQMYEKTKQGVSFLDEIYFEAYGRENDIYMRKNLASEASYNINFIRNKYIVCEFIEYAACFADGMSRSYWILQYRNGKFEYVNSLTQPGFASSCSQYIYYKLENGQVVNEEIYYGFHNNKAKYETYEQAVTKYFEIMNMKIYPTRINDIHKLTKKSVLKESKESTKLLSFNVRAKTLYFNGTTGQSKHRLKATIDMKKNIDIK